MSSARPQEQLRNIRCVNHQPNLMYVQTSQVGAAAGVIYYVGKLAFCKYYNMLQCRNTNRKL